MCADMVPGPVDMTASVVVGIGNTHILRPLSQLLAQGRKQTVTYGLWFRLSREKKGVRIERGQSVFSVI